MTRSVDEPDSASGDTAVINHKSMSSRQPGSTTTSPALDSATNTSHSETVRETGRWRSLVALVLVAAGAGLVAKRPSLLLISAVGVVFVTYTQLTKIPSPSLSISRQVETTDDDNRLITTTVRNTGSKTVFDLRIVDGVPPMLTVSSGSPRCATALRPGGSVTLTYEVAVRPGYHQFQETTVVCRDPSGTHEVATALTEPTTIKAKSGLPTLPITGLENHTVGRLATETAGDGIEFHSVDDYEPGDPADRIDWRRFARTGELTTVAFHGTVTAEVLICIDTSGGAYRAASDAEPHAVAHAISAAAQIGDALFEANHRVGLAAIGGDTVLLPPGAGSQQVTRFHRLLQTDPAFALTPPPAAELSEANPGTPTEATTGTQPTIDEQVSAITTRCSSTTQVLVITPACDDTIQFAHQFGSRDVTVISPDVTTGSTAGGLLARVQRADRLTALRNAGVSVIDWEPTEPLGAALVSAKRRQR
jgi:uncharacterized protein (DUF58 family)